MAVSADGQTVVSGGGIDATVRVWGRAKTAVLRVLTDRDDSVHAVAVSADGQTVVSGGEDRTVQVWNLAVPAAPQVLTAGPVHSVAVSGDGRTAVSSGYGKVLVWDLDKTDTPREFTRPDGLLYAIAVSADGRTTVSGGDETVRVWDLDSALEQARWIADADVLAVAVSTAVAIAGDAAGRVLALRLNEPAQASA